MAANVDWADLSAFYQAPVSAVGQSRDCADDLDGQGNSWLAMPVELGSGSAAAAGPVARPHGPPPAQHMDARLTHRDLDTDLDKDLEDSQEDLESLFSGLGPDGQLKFGLMFGHLVTPEPCPLCLSTASQVSCTTAFACQSRKLARDAGLVLSKTIEKLLL